MQVADAQTQKSKRAGHQFLKVEQETSQPVDAHSLSDGFLDRNLMRGGGESL